MDHFIHTPGETASRVESLPAPTLRAPSVHRLQASEVRGRHVAVFSLDYGDDSENGGLVVLVSPAEAVHFCEWHPSTRGDGETALDRALRSYSNALDSLTRLTRRARP